MSRRSSNSPKDIIGARLLTMIPMAPFSECAQRKINDLSKRGSPMPGIAISIWPSRKGDCFMGSPVLANASLVRICAAVKTAI